MTELDPRPALSENTSTPWSDDDHDLDLHADDLEAEDDEGEWLGGLRRAGLPVRATAVATSPSPGLSQLLGEAHRPASPGLLDLVANSIAEGTRTAYEADWADFSLWCRIHDRGDPLQADALAVAEYINELVRTPYAMSTIRRRVSAIGWCQQLAAGGRSTSHDLVTTALAGAERLLAGRGVKQATPLRLADAQGIILGLPIADPERPGMRRDQLVVALGWASALRAGELVALDVDDLTVVGDPNTGVGGLLIRVKPSKAALRPEWVAVPFASSWATCPVRKTITYLRGVRSGPILRSIDRHGRTGGRLSARAVSDIVRDTITTCLRFDAAGFSGHSLRAGFVVEARSRRVPDHLIARHTRHARPGSRAGGMLDVYDRPEQLLETPALDPSWW